MSFNKDEILSLTPQEKIALAEELWSSVEEELLPVSNDEIRFAEERLKMHEENPLEGMSLASFKKYFADKYGF
ncbi:MAG TPA: addiction module protein [Parafilimonas sp.]|nr:addiction module protein [Parafilimonas sp.]